LKNSKNIVIEDNIFNASRSSKRSILLERSSQDIKIDRNQFKTNSVRPIQYDVNKKEIMIGKNTTVRFDLEKK